MHLVAYVEIVGYCDQRPAAGRHFSVERTPPLAIESVLLNVSDIERSAEFYRRHLDATVVASGPDSAELDLVTARLVLTRVDAPAASTWVGDDLQRGFRHVG